MYKNDEDPKHKQEIYADVDAISNLVMLLNCY